MEKKLFARLPAALAVAATLGCCETHAAVIAFDDPSADFTSASSVSVASGASSITAKDIALEGQSITAALSEYGELGAGSMTIKAKDAHIGSYRQSVSIASTQRNASYSGQIDLEGDLAITSGLSVELIKSKSNPARAENKLSINASSIDIKGSNNALSVSYGYEGGGPVPGGLVDVSAKADTIKILGEHMNALYVDGNGSDATDTEGTHLTLEAKKMELTGGWSYGTTYTSDIAVFVCQGASLNLIGDGPEAELTITAKPYYNDATALFGRAAILGRGGYTTVKYGEQSKVTFDGGLVVFAPYPDEYSGTIDVQIGEGSHTELDGVLATIEGTLKFSAKGSFRIETPFILTQAGQVKIDLETGSSGDESGLLKGDVESYYGGTVDIRLAGPKNEFVGTTLIVEYGNDPGHIHMNLENGSTWQVEVEDDTDDGSDTLNTLSLSKGILNLAHRNGDEDTTYRTVRADALKGAGGTLNFNLELNSEKEENDRLILKTFESGDHTVHVEAHSGFEPVDMQGYLIRADEWQGGTFTADTNKLEAGVYLYNYTVAYRPGEEEGQTDWYLTFDQYVPPEPEPEPKPDPEPKPEPTPDPGPGPQPKPEPELSPSGEAVASLAGMGAQTAMYLAQLSDVRKRLGEVRRGAVEGLWASAGGSGDHISGFRGTGFKQDAYRFNFGFDRKAGEWLLGGALKAMTADQKTRGTQFRGEGDAHSEGFNLYATWTGENGSYADFVAGLDRYHEKLSTRMLNGAGVSGAYRNIGLGLSAEVGHQFMTKGAWFIEPQAQLSYYRLWGDDFSLSNGMKVSQKNFNGLTGRVGLASGKEFRKADGAEAGQLYARLGVKHELMGDQEIRVNGIRFKDGLLGTRVYYGLGAEWLIARNVKVFGHVERENGSRYTREFDFNVGVKYAF